MAVARREVLEFVRSLAERFPDYGVEGEVYVTAPGARSTRTHELVAAIDDAHEQVFGARPERDVHALVQRRVGADALRHPDRRTTARRRA